MLLGGIWAKSSFFASEHLTESLRVLGKSLWVEMVHVKMLTLLCQRFLEMFPS
jgi:hypothetical protein